MKSEIVWIS